ncbi:MAG: hypothetical protein BWX50_00605 [Euryarchaeota archaeon ADurb.Bin009]|nr:MAG: hypothetical protein BWX50_00605 [Euryarchaeota archaeon ADurb.Bin009]
MLKVMFAPVISSNRAGVSSMYWYGLPGAGGMPGAGEDCFHPVTISMVSPVPVAVTVLTAESPPTL